MHERAQQQMCAWCIISIVTGWVMVFVSKTGSIESGHSQAKQSQYWACSPLHALSVAFSIRLLNCGSVDELLLQHNDLYEASFQMTACGRKG